MVVTDVIRRRNPRQAGAIATIGHHGQPGWGACPGGPTSGRPIAEPQYGYDPNARVTMFGAVLAMFYFTCHCHVRPNRHSALPGHPRRAVREDGAGHPQLADAAVTLILAVVGLGLLAYFRAHPICCRSSQTVLSRFPTSCSPASLVGCRWIRAGVPDCWPLRCSPVGRHQFDLLGHQ